MDKPREIELIEKFLKLEAKLGHSEEELTNRMVTALKWFVENRIQKRLDSAVEKLALPKVLSIATDALADEVKEALSKG